MSLLLTPVALICPIFSSATAALTQAPQSRDDAHIAREQAMCRIATNDMGVTNVSVGMHTVAIYPIHYVESEKPYITFSMKLVSQMSPVKIQMWTGSADQQRISDKVTLYLDKEEFKLPLIYPAGDLNLQRDRLCLSFDNGHGSQTEAHIQLHA